MKLRWPPELHAWLNATSRRFHSWKRRFLAPQRRSRPAASRGPAWLIPGALVAAGLTVQFVRTRARKRNSAFVHPPRPPGGPPPSPVQPDETHEAIRRAPASGINAFKGSASWGELLKTTVTDWIDDKAPQLAAALAYYTVFSIAPLLLIALAIVGTLFGEEAVRGELRQQLSGFLGEQGSRGVEDLVAGARQPHEGVIATILGAVALVFGASGVFGQLQSSMNAIWEVERIPGIGVMRLLKDRFLSFSMVLGVAFLLLVSLIISTLINALGRFMAGYLPAPEVVLESANFAASFLIITVLFAMIFKFIPDAKIEWRDVWLGAITTALLFTAGKWALGAYLGRASIGSTYGAAGTLVIVLLWVYYSSQILFLGAEFTQAVSRSRGTWGGVTRGARRVAAGP